MNQVLLLDGDSYRQHGCFRRGHLLLQQVVPGVQLLNQHGQFTEQIGEYDRAKTVEECAKCDLDDSSGLQIVTHEVKAGCVRADPVLIIK